MVNLGCLCQRISLSHCSETGKRPVKVYHLLYKNMVTLETKTGKRPVFFSYCSYSSETNFVATRKQCHDSIKEQPTLKHAEMSPKYNLINNIIFKKTVQLLGSNKRDLFILIFSIK